MNNGTIKIGDFGSAVQLSNSDEYA